MQGGYDAANTWACYAQRSASHIRGAPPALYHLFLLSAIASAEFCTSSGRLLSILEQTRQRYRFVVVGYVVMPEHIHLLMTEPEVGNPSTVMQVLKQRTARALLPKRKRRDPRQLTLFADGAAIGLSGRHASTTSTFGQRRSEWKS